MTTARQRTRQYFAALASGTHADDDTRHTETLTLPDPAYTQQQKKWKKAANDRGGAKKLREARRGLTEFHKEPVLTLQLYAALLKYTVLLYT